MLDYMRKISLGSVMVAVLVAVVAFAPTLPAAATVVFFILSRKEIRCLLLLSVMAVQ